MSRTGLEVNHRVSDASLEEIRGCSQHGTHAVAMSGFSWNAWSFAPLVGNVGSATGHEGHSRNVCSAAGLSKGNGINPGGYNRRTEES